MGVPGKASPEPSGHQRLPVPRFSEAAGELPAPIEFQKPGHLALLERENIGGQHKTTDAQGDATGPEAGLGGIERRGGPSKQKQYKCYRTKSERRQAFLQEGGTQKKSGQAPPKER